MRIARLFAASFLLLLTSGALAEVSITELEDRISVKVDGQLFTEWRHKDWAAPFLYPVVGPTGQNITRNYPMKEGVVGDDADHPWHRSIRFSHSDVNGFNFWWAAGKEKMKHTAEIKLEKVERVTSGRTGEIILWNQWLGDGKLVLREKVRLVFIPLENRQMLMDYDVELHAGQAAVTLGDKRDGGMLVRVAGTMKVEDEKGKKGEGAIVNSRGDRNAAAWGKRAEWVDYFGPDINGQTVGIAMFDHPANLRFPTPWHARTYGLMSANRFGTDHFKGNYDDHKTVICKPFGKDCPACNSHSGDYAIAAGASVTLRHRLYFHYGDSQAGKVAEQFNEYAGERESIILRMRALVQDRRWKDLIEQVGKEDFAAWPAEHAAEALYLRGQTYTFSKAGAQAEIDLKAAAKLSSKPEMILLTLGDNYTNNLNDDEKAIAAYRQLAGLTGRNNGWLPITVTLSIARLLNDQLKHQEALDTLRPFDDMKEMAPIWRIRLLRMYGHVYAAQGKEAESLAKFREALELEAAQKTPMR